MWIGRVWSPGSYQESLTFRFGEDAIGVNIRMRVEAPNQEPVLASIGSRNVSEGGSLTIELTASDADGDALTYSVSGNPSGSSLTNRMFRWTPTHAQAGTYRVTFTVSDNRGGTDSETVTITVRETNRPPVLTHIGSRNVSEGGSLTIELTASDADGDALTYSVSGNPSGSSLTNRMFRWTPTHAQAGTYRVTFTVSDNRGGTDSETVTITVGQTNRPPVLAGIGNRNVSEGNSLTINLTASDADGDALTYSVSGNPSGSSLANRTFRWTPTYTQAGTYRVTFTVSDNRGGTDSETITITVGGTNQPPVLARIGDKSVREENGLTIELTASDADGDALTYSVSGNPSGSSLMNRTFRWTPVRGQAGTYQVMFTVSDGKGGMDTETITITVMRGETVVPGTDITVSLPGGVTLKMVWIEAGTFTMGSPASEEGRWASEGPQHEVTISKGFYLGQFELTQSQWEAVMETTPWAGREQVQSGADFPAVYLSWNDVQTFINRLNDAAGADVYRLPTEAEWEYACRAGTTTRWSFGDAESQLSSYAWYRANAADMREEYGHKVGAKSPNKWGLYDMHGNVGEWVGGLV